MGVEHHRTTPVQPQSNGRTERFNRTLKEMLQKLVNNASDRWEGQLITAMLAYRTSVSTTTGYTPFFLLYGHRSRMPLTTALRVSSENAFGNRLDDLARALKMARAMTEDSRKYNRIAGSISWDEYHPRPPCAPPRRRIYNHRPRPLNARDNDLLQQPAGAPEQQVAPPDSDNDVDLDQSGDASENYAPPTESMLTQDDNINERPTGQRQLTERALLAAQDNDQDNLIGFHYRKRQRSPAPDQNIQKRSRCEAIALVSTFLGYLC